MVTGRIRIIDQYTVNGLFGYSPAEDVDVELSAYHLDYDSSIPGSESYPESQCRAGRQENRGISETGGAGRAG